MYQSQNEIHKLQANINIKATNNNNVLHHHNHHQHHHKANHINHNNTDKKPQLGKSTIGIISRPTSAGSASILFSQISDHEYTSSINLRKQSPAHYKRPLPLLPISINETIDNNSDGNLLYTSSSWHYIIDILGDYIEKNLKGKAKFDKRDRILVCSVNDKNDNNCKIEFVISLYISRKWKIQSTNYNEKTYVILIDEINGKQEKLKNIKPLLLNELRKQDIIATKNVTQEQEQKTIANDMDYNHQNLYINLNKLELQPQTEVCKSHMYGANYMTKFV